jgi:hypothetical protein
MILQVHTEKELIEMVVSLKKELDELRGYNKNLFKRLNALEVKKPEVQVIKELTTHEIRLDGATSKKEIEDIKKSILEIKPIINNLTTGVTSDDVLKLINKHVILSYINKLYGK